MGRATRPVIGFLLGDASGIGPEIAVKLLSQADTFDEADVLLIGDPSALASGERIAGTQLNPLLHEGAAAWRFEPGRVTFLSLPGLGREPVLGTSNVESGAAAMAALDRAAALARDGVVQGIVFAPFNKHSLRLGGLAEEDELRHLQRTLAAPGFVCEFNITGDLWTSRVTSHVPLRDVAALITPDAIGDAVRLIDTALRQAGVAAPRIAVSGLNPHAGDGGSIGMEEIEIIEPAVGALTATGLDVRGPFSPDTVFIAARRGDFDAVVSMYHDQGQIAMKLMGFERGVTLHGGLPVPVCTCASGSAFDLAGKGVARFEGLQQAYRLCVRMAKTSA